MSEYVKKKSEMNFKTIEDLNQIQKVIDEADLALHDESRTIETSSIPETLAGAMGAGVGGALGFAALAAGGAAAGGGLAAGGGVAVAMGGAAIGGGLAAGAAVVAAPVVALAAGGVGLAVHLKNKKLKEAKELCYQNAVEKHTALKKLIGKEYRNDNPERARYLRSLDKLLKAAISDLKHDLGIE